MSLFVSETEARAHGEEARAMHSAIQNSASGRVVSEFIVQTCAAKMAEAHETSIAKVTQLSQILMSALNSHDGLERTGFVDDSRALLRGLRPRMEALTAAFEVAKPDELAVALIRHAPLQ